MVAVLATASRRTSNPGPERAAAVIDRIADAVSGRIAEALCSDTVSDRPRHMAGAETAALVSGSASFDQRGYADLGPQPDRSPYRNCNRSQFGVAAAELRWSAGRTVDQRCDDVELPVGNKAAIEFPGGRTPRRVAADTVSMKQRVDRSADRLARDRRCETAGRQLRRPASGPSRRAQWQRCGSAMSSWSGVPAPITAICPLAYRRAGGVIPRLIERPNKPRRCGSICRRASGRTLVDVVERQDVGDHRRY